MALNSGGLDAGYDQGYKAHRLGQGVHECPYNPGVLRKDWRRGWMGREKSMVDSAVAAGQRLPRRA